MTTLLTTVFLASLLGSLHCAGMCGPFVAFAVSPNPKLSARGAIQLAPQLAYHGGRLVMYAGLGALAGLLGSAINTGGALAGFEHAAAVVAGVTLVAIGILTCLQQFAIRVPGFALPAPVRAALDSGVCYAGRLSPFARAGLIGLLTALLPCGWLYGFVVAAAGTGGSAAGAALMIAFWAGTVPILAGLGVTVQGAAKWLGRRVQLLASAALVFLGVFIAWGRVSALDAIRAANSAPSASTAAVVSHVHELETATPACCEEEP